MDKLPLVQITLPLYNESKKLAASVETLVNHLENTKFPYPYTIVLANNASTDGSREICDDLSKRFDRVKVLHMTEKGKGIAIRRAWKEFGGDILSFMDVDLASDLNYFRPLIDLVAVEKNDLAVGIRLGPKSKIIDRRFYREVMSRCYNLIIRMLLRTGISDHQCGFKAMSRKAFEQIATNLADNGFFIDTELIAWSRKKGLRVAGLDIVWTDKRDSKVKVAKTSLQFLKRALDLRKRVNEFHA